MGQTDQFSYEDARNRDFEQLCGADNILTLIINDFMLQKRHILPNLHNYTYDKQTKYHNGFIWPRHLPP